MGMHFRLFHKELNNYANNFFITIITIILHLYTSNLYLYFYVKIKLYY